VAHRPVERVVADHRFERLVPADAEVMTLATGAIWAEGPVYVPDDDSVIWSDVRRNLVRRWSAADGSRDVFHPSDFANGHTLDHDGSILACEHGPRRISRYQPDGTRTTVVDRFDGDRLNSPNDLVVASDGAIWFTDPPYGILDDSEGYKADCELGGCFVFRLDRATGALSVATDFLAHPNGLAFSPDERTLYVSDTSVARIDGGNHHIVAFDVTGDWRLMGPRVFAVIEPGVSDGFRVDVHGNVWTSAGDGIHVLDPHAVELGRILLPEEASNCTFGGPDGQRLFITATSSLYAIQVGIRGAVTPWVDTRPG
jgi:gluconolactonase